MSLFNKNCKCNIPFLKQEFEDYKTALQQSYMDETNRFRNKFDIMQETIDKNMNYKIEGIFLSLEKKITSDLDNRFTILEERLERYIESMLIKYNKTP